MPRQVAIWPKQLTIISNICRKMLNSITNTQPIRAQQQAMAIFRSQSGGECE